MKEQENFLGQQMASPPELSVERWKKKIRHGARCLITPLLLTVIVQAEKANLPPLYFDPSTENPKVVCPNEWHELGAASWGEESISSKYACCIEVKKEVDGFYHVYVGPQEACSDDF